MSSPSNKHTEAVRLVIRLLPPGLTQDQFEAQITQYTTQWHLVNNYYYVAGAYPEKPYELPTYSRAYFVVPDADTATKVQAELRAKAFSDGELNGASVPIIGKALYENKEYAAVPRTILKERKKKKTIEQLAQFQRFVAFLDGKTESYLFKAPKKQKKPKAKNQNTDQKAKNKSSEKDKDTKETTKKPKKKSKKPKTPKDKDVLKEPNDPKIVEKKKKKKKPKAPQNAPGTAKQGNKAPQPNKDLVSDEQSGQQSNQNSHKGENDVKAPKINQKKKPKPPKKKPKGKPPASSPSNPQGPAGSQTQPTNATS